MRRVPMILAALLSIALAPTAREAAAHGGQFRGPGGSLPPKLREPHDPPATPPPPPPPTTTPGPSGGTPPSGGPGPTTPPDGGPLPPVVTPPDPAGAPAGSGRRASLTYESWIFWYEHNREGIEGLKRAIYTRIGSGNPLQILGADEEPAAQRGGETQMTSTHVERDVVPVLLALLDPTNARDPDVEGAAAIALAKVTRDERHVDRLLGLLAVEKDAARPELVRESAALALGLLRRAEPAAQLSAAALDRARAGLFRVLEDERSFPTRTRGFAAAALGLLGDQPSGSGERAGDEAGARRETSARLAALLVRLHADDTLPVAVLLALGAQPRASLEPETVGLLEQAAQRSQLGPVEASALVRSYAVQALGRLGDAGFGRLLLNVLGARSTDVLTRRSAAIALGRVGAALAPAERAALARDLAAALDRASDASTRNFGTMSLAYLAAGELPAASTETLEGAGVGARLLEAAREGERAQRPFAALALGWVLREMDDLPPTAAHAAWRRAALGALREGLASQALDPRDRAAFAVALGMSGDRDSQRVLLAHVEDTKAERTLRGYAAIGLGLLGHAGPEVRRGLRGLLTERSSEELTLQGATALGLAGDKGAVDLLVEALGTSQGSHARSRILLALAQIGDARALAPITALAKDSTQPDALRALATAGLGMVGDLEWTPSLAILTRDLNYRAVVDMVAELVTIL